MDEKDIITTSTIIWIGIALFVVGGISPLVELFTDFRHPGVEIVTAVIGAAVGIWQLSIVRDRIAATRKYARNQSIAHNPDIFPNLFGPGKNQ